MPDNHLQSDAGLVGPTWEKAVVVLWRLPNFWANGGTLCERKWTDWMDQQQANLAGAGMVLLCPSGPYGPMPEGGMVPRGQRGPTLTSAETEHENPQRSQPLSLSHFFFQKIANVNKLSVHTCFGIWMETLVCAPPPALLPPYLSTFTKWVVLAQPQTNSELFC